MPDTDTGIGREMRRLADAVTKLVRSHVELAKAELREEVRGRMADALLGSLALPFLLAALLLLDVALALVLASWLGQAAGFALAGLLNLAVGGGLAAMAAARARRRDAPLSDTAEEIERNRLLAAQVRQAMREESGPLPPPSIRPYGVDSERTAS